MQWLQTILDNSTTPALTACVLGLLTAISPCPLATNIAAIGYLSKDVENKNRVLWNGLLYTLGRTIAYTLLAWALLLVLDGGASIFGVQRFFATWGDRLLGPLMVLIGIFLLVGDRIPLPAMGIKHPYANRTLWGAFVLGLLFALSFCPTSGVLYFGGLIPLALTSSYGWILPILFAVTTAVPVLIVSILLAYSVRSIGRFMQQMKAFQKWFSWIVGVLFILIGIYYIVAILI